MSSSNPAAAQIVPVGAPHPGQPGLSIPEGWKRLYADTMRQLRMAAQAKPARASALRSLVVFAPDHELNLVLLRSSDEVMDGIAAKCLRRSRWICRCCGRAGRPRHFDYQRVEALCARCAAPRMLQFELEGLQAMLPLLSHVGASIHVYQVPPLLRRRFRASAGVTQANGAQMTVQQLRCWLDSITPCASTQ